MNDNHSNLALAISWAGLLAGFLTPVAILLTVVFTGLNIYMRVRQLRREDRLEKLRQLDSTL